MSLGLEVEMASFSEIESRLRLGDFSSARDDMKTAVELWAEGRLEPAAQVRVAACAAELCFYCGNNAKGQEIVDDAERLFRVDGDLPARSRLQRAEFFYSQRKFEEAERWAEAICTSCRERHDLWGVGECSYFLARCAMRLHRPVVFSRCDAAAEAFTSATPNRDPEEVKWRLGLVHLVAGFAGWDLGQFDAARSRLFTAKWLLAETQDVMARANVDHTIGTTLRSQAESWSDYDEAIKVLQIAATQYEHLGHSINLARVHTNLGRAHLDRQEFALAEASFETGLSRARDIGDRITRDRQMAEVYVWMSWLYQQRPERDIKRAEAYARRARRLCRGNASVSRILIESELAFGDCLKARGRPDRALKCFMVALAGSEKLRIAKLEAGSHLSLAKLYSTSETLRDVRKAWHHYTLAQVPVTNSSRYLRSQGAMLERLIRESSDMWIITKNEFLEGGRSQAEDNFRRWMILCLEGCSLNLRQQSEHLKIKPRGLHRMKMRLFPHRQGSRGPRRSNRAHVRRREGQTFDE
jgi:tetratricopeptide (TPR) repeat protein